MAGRIVALAEPLVLLALAPLLIFPTFRPAWTATGLALLALVWVARGVIRREVWPDSPANVALLVMVLAISVAVWASPARELSVPKLTGLILGLATFRAIGLGATTTRTRRLALAAFALLGLGLWAFGVLGGGIPAAQPLAQRLPPALYNLIVGEDRAVNPNVIAGGLAPYLPIAAALAVYCWQAKRRGLALGLAFASLVVAATLALTRSRSAMAGAVAGILALAFLLGWFRVGPRGRQALAIGFAALIVVGVVAGAVLVARSGGDGTATIAPAGEGAMLNKELSLASRVEIWARALYALQDFPFTGIGLGAYPRVMPLLYPLFLVPPDLPLAHAHNIFLQTGLDLGLIGLIGYLAVTLASGVAAWQAAGASRGFTHFLALGLLAALIGIHIYGLTDSLDAKPAIVLWAALGLIAALPAPVSSPVQSQRPKSLLPRQGNLDQIQHPVRKHRGPDAPRPQKKRAQGQPHQRRAEHA